ncbi:hypothetical protein FRC01_008514 [Tulasnella sp. 417]|nr:hypothetical protein FRC01_008514 [Tulasnella sp. 417]
MLVLPPELLELVLGHLGKADFPGPERNTIKSLTLTCSILRSIAQPILFSVVRIGDTTKRDDRRVADIRSLFQSRPESAQWIRRLYISIYNSQSKPGNMMRIDMTALARDLEMIFLDMTRLQVVDIRNTRVTSAMHTHLWVLARGSLRELRCQEIEVDDILGIMPPTTELGIEVFGLDFPSWKPHAPIAKMIHGPRLRRLQFSWTALASVFQTYNLSDRATPTPVLSELQYLELPSYYSMEIEEYFSFLACCPNLRTLIIPHLYSLPPSVSVPLPSDAISQLFPSLSEYAGPLELCRSLCPGRPIRAIKLPRGRRPSITREDMAALAQGTVPLEALELVLTDFEETTFSDLVDFFPKLKGLDIRFDRMPSYAELERDLERFMHEMHRLQTLNLTGFDELSWNNVDAAAELDLLTKTHAAGPSLKFVSLPREALLGIQRRLMVP